ncbi:GntR family transcriptional regulator [Enterococcus sp. LJL99]
MLLEIKTESETPIYQQICEQLIIGIAKGELLPGESLPSVRQLADEIGVNMMTVSKAYQTLKNDGYILTDRRNGTKVATFQKTDEAFYTEFSNAFELLLAKAHIQQLDEQELHKQLTAIHQKFKK